MAGTESSSVSSLPWIWVFEALTRHHQVNMPILNDLVSRASIFPDDWGKNAREKAALRCLEEMFDQSRESTHLPVTSDPRVGFDLSESCEYVLQRVLTGLSLTDLKMPGPEMLKWNVRPFIMHKKASLSKCSLDLLKDTLIKGTHPSASFLLDKSELPVRDQVSGKRVHVDNGGSNSIFPEFGVGGADHPIEAEDEHLTTFNSDNGNKKLRGDSLNLTKFSSKRDRSTSTRENLVGQVLINSMKKVRDLQPNNKKHKPGISSTGQDFVHANELLETPHTETVVCHSAEELGGSLERVRNFENVNDLSRAQQNNVTDDVIHSCDNEMPQNVSDGPNNINMSAKRDSREDASSDSDGYHVEEIEVAVTKKKFLSSQLTFREDTRVWTEQNLCTKCNKDGNLLHCCGSACPFVVHENCIGSSANFDKDGNFYCPFCAYSCAVTKYLKSKKKISHAREQVTMFLRNGCQKENLYSLFLLKEKKKTSAEEDGGIQANNEYQTENYVDNENQTNNQQIKEALDDEQHADSPSF